MNRKRTSIQPFVHGKVLVLDLRTSAREAARAMSERRVGSVIVSDDQGQLVGVVTDRDLACQVLAFGLPNHTQIFEVMTPGVLAVQEDADVLDAIRIMEKHGIRRVPVIRLTQQGREKCVGIVTLDDLIAAQLIGSEQLKRVVGSQVLTRSRSHLSSEHADNRKEDTLNRFQSILARRMGLGLEKGAAESAVFGVLSDIVQRLPYTTAAQFIAQLPKLLQEDLLDLPAGPRDSISAETILAGLQSSLGGSQERARAAARGFWEGLGEFLKQAPETEHLLEALPEDLRELFGSGRESPSAPTASSIRAARMTGIAQPRG